ncbi:MAG: hypothetical protein AAF961_00770 [Planctomycetota bacterium]
MQFALFKRRLDAEFEPSRWRVEHVEQGDADVDSASHCLASHNADVTIHEVGVVPLENSVGRKGDVR